MSHVANNYIQTVSFKERTKRSYRDKRVAEAFAEDAPVLIDAIPSSGKSYSVLKWAAETGNQLTIFTARRDLFNQLAKWCDDLGLTATILPSFHRDCPTAKGDHGETWERRIEDNYKLGIHPGEIHVRDEELFGEQLPCQLKGICHYTKSQWEQPEDYDVVIGHYRHAHVPERIQERYVVLDEFPAGEFLLEFSAMEVNAAVETYLEHHDDLPFRSANSLKYARPSDEKYETAVSWFNDHDPDLGRSVDLSLEDVNRDTHVEAASLTYALLTSEELQNEWWYADLPNGKVAVQGQKGSLYLLNRPDLSEASSVVALDGTPIPEMWEIILGPTLKHDQILTPKEKGQYLHDDMGFQIIQTTEATKPYSKSDGSGVATTDDLPLIEAIKRREGARPVLISTKGANTRYEEYDAFPELIAEKAHYSDFKGSNDFGNVKLGLVIGCQHFGDPYVEKWAALAGVPAQRVKGTKGMTLSYGSELGDAVLRSMRENEVLQAILRFGRECGGATVYVHTAALPEWVIRKKITYYSQYWHEGMREIVEILRSSYEDGATEWRTNDITGYDGVSISDQMVRKHLHKLVSFGYMDKRKEKRGLTWVAKRVEELPRFGHVSFADEAGKSYN